MSSVKIKQIPLELNWHEGMLLSPHQFQQNDLRIQQTIGSHCFNLDPYHYGVCSLSIDTVALSDGIFRINEIEAIFQDGVIFSYCHKKIKNLKPLEVSLASIAEDVYEFYVFLCLAEYSEDVSPVLGNPARYYSIEGSAVSDFNVKDLVVKLPRLYPNVFLCVGVGVPESCIGFPVAKLSKFEGVHKIIDWTYPCLFLAQEASITQKCVGIASTIREKAVFLSDKLSTQSGGVGSYDIEKLLMRLLTVLPVLEGIVCLKLIKPYDLYNTLLYVLGCVSTLIPLEVPPVLMPYNHVNLDSCFNQIIGLIEYYVATIERGFEIQQFSRDEKFFYIYISNDNLARFRDGKIFIGARGSNSVDGAKIEKWIDGAVIVSDFAVNDVRSKRIKGAMRRRASQDKVFEITPGIGVSVFEIEIDAKFICGNQNLHIFNQGVQRDEMPAELMIYIPRDRR